MEQTQPSHSNSKLSNENSNKKNTDYWKLEQWKLISHMWTKKIAINIQIFAGWSLARFGKLVLINFTLVVRVPFTLDKPWYEVVFLIIQLILCEFKGKKRWKSRKHWLGCFICRKWVKKNFHPENSHSSNSPWKIPTEKISAQKILTWNNPTHVFKYSHPSV